MSNFIKHINPVGRPPLYETPAQLWDKFVEYCTWCDSNPIELPSKVNLKGSKKEIEERSEGKITARRPYVLCGFTVWAGIANWYDFKTAKAYQQDEFPIIIRAIEDTIRSQQVAGAMVGLYNANLTARLNNITDKPQPTAQTEEQKQQKANATAKTLQLVEAKITELTEMMKANGNYNAAKYQMQITLAAQLVVKTEILFAETMAPDYNAVNVQISREGNERESVSAKEQLYRAYAQQSQSALRALGLNADAKPERPDGDNLEDFFNSIKEEE